MPSVHAIDEYIHYITKPFIDRSYNNILLNPQSHDEPTSPHLDSSIIRSSHIDITISFPLSSWRHRFAFRPQFTPKLNNAVGSTYEFLLYGNRYDSSPYVHAFATPLYRNFFYLRTILRSLPARIHRSRHWLEISLYSLYVVFNQQVYCMYLSTAVLSYNLALVTPLH
jgi:hypothetical protein